MFRSIRARLTLWYTIIVAVIFVFIATVTYKYVSATLYDQLDLLLVNEARWIAQRLEKQNVESEPDESAAAAIREHSAYSPTKEFVEVWAPDGTLLCQSSNVIGDSLVKHTDFPPDPHYNLHTVVTFRIQPLRILTQLTRRGRIIVAIPVESVETTLRQLMRVLAWMGPLVVLLAFGGGLFLSKKSLSKVNQVTDIARKISADRLSARIPSHNVDDEIGRLIETFNGMISRLDASFEQMKQFSADASHELRTPLTVLRTQLETALASRMSASEIRKIAAQCLDEAIRMGSILENLLLLGRGDSGQLSIKRERVRLDDLLRETYDESVILASQKSIEVKIENTDNVPIWGDRQRLRQLILNLVDNAIKYSGERTVITLSLVKNEGEAAVAVRDQGIGIPKSEISRIFDRFYRVDRARSRTLGGSGLGLAIVKWIVDAHGGTITVKSAVNKGSEFTVSLPVAVK
ncbi:MAG TPA: ATP-binding protein [Bacteroidota bacterium]|nr:ATP-binding protein [Bacteroidota bacterium]